MDKYTALSLSKITTVAIQDLGQMIRNCRLEHGISQQDLAERINISRYSIMAIEKGDPKIAVGVVFEAAYIVGIPLLGGELKDLQNLSVNLAKLTNILPKKAPKRTKDIEDDF